jgi:hypothetical protein
MAKLYSRTGADAHKDPEHGLFEPDGDGAFGFPDDLSDVLLRQHVGKKRMWEDEEMRAERMHQEAEQRHRDPAVLYAAVSELVQLSKQAQGAAAVPADLAAELAELRREIAELRASAAPVTGGPDGEDADGAGEARPADKPRPPRKPAAPKSAA